MSDKESYQDKIAGTHYGGQQTTLGRGERCLREALQPLVARPEIFVEDVSKTQNVHPPTETHTGATREVMCGYAGCSEVVVVATELNADGKEIVTGYSNPRVSQPLENCAQIRKTIPL
ncbi:MAG: hypothetical protein U0524_03605 [Candidatus Saccharimonadales bacterium]